MAPHLGRAGASSPGTARSQVWHLAVGSFINGFGWTTDNPLRRMMMGEAVGRDRMAMAMAFDVGAAQCRRMVGPTVGGLLLVGIGIEGALLLSAALYAIAIAATLAVRSRFAVSPEAGAVLARTWEAMRSSWPTSGSAPSWW